MESIIIKCDSCRVKNRIPSSKTSGNPLCGKCGTPLNIMDSPGVPVDINDQSFESEVLSCPGVVLVDCWAPWCGPCRMVAPVLEELASEYRGKVKIVKLDTDENPKAAMKYNIRSIPTMLIFKGGDHIDTLVGVLPKQEIEKRLVAVL
ncbi:thioredoxin [Thermodesulfobacteriota bacterium]